MRRMGLYAGSHRPPLRYLGLLALGSIAAQAAHAKGTEHGHQRPHVAVDAIERASLPASGIGAAALDPQQRLAQKGMSAGSPVMIRIFKAESELELWLKTQDRFELFATYAICFWSGRLGPKLREGDRQAPEGFYAVGLRQLHPIGKRPRSFDIGYPNALDRAAGRTGSSIWIHGGCSSIGCYAMTDMVMREIYALGERALAQGQDHFQVEVFPFRMTEENMRTHADSPWFGFWTNLKEAYDAFERAHIPPKIAMCGGRYIVSEGVLNSEGDLAVAPETPPRMCENGFETALLGAEQPPAGPAETRVHAYRRQSHGQLLGRSHRRLHGRQASWHAPRHHAHYGARHAILAEHRSAKGSGQQRHRHAPLRAGRDRAAHHVRHSAPLACKVGACGHRPNPHARA